MIAVLTPLYGLGEGRETRAKGKKFKVEIERPLIICARKRPTLCGS